MNFHGAAWRYRRRQTYMGYEICTYDEGFISALLESFTGKKFEVKEIDCWSTGDRTCRFCAKAVTELKQEEQELLSYLKALVFNVKMTDGIPEKFAEDENFLELDRSLKAIH